MPAPSLILAWALVGLLFGMLIGGLRQHRRLRADLELLRRLHTEEKSAHYQTHRTLTRRERQLGGLLKQLQGMEEIAHGSAQLAQIYESMVAEARGGESRPMGLDEEGGTASNPARRL